MRTDDATRVFTSGGTVAHILGWHESPNDTAAEALCGRTPWPGLFLGTGSQSEYDRAAELPTCAPCHTVYRFQNGGAP